MLSRHTIQEALGRLNTLLAPAVERVEESLGVKFGDAPFLGLAVESADATRGMSVQDRVEPSAELLAWPGVIANDSLFQTLKQYFRVQDATDFGLLLLALAPEFNSGYEKVFGFLQDDVTRRRASVELAVSLFGPGGNSGVVSRLSNSAPLVANRLIDLADPLDGRTGLNARVIRLDEQFARWIFGATTLDRRLAAVAEVNQPKTDIKALPVSRELAGTLDRLARLNPLRLYLHGPDNRVSMLVADALAKLTDRRLLVVDAGRVATADGLSSDTARLLIREANWFSHLLVLIGLDALHTPDRQSAWDRLASVLSKHSVSHLVLLGSRPTMPPTSHALAPISLEIPMPDPDERFDCWLEALKPVAPKLSDQDLQLLADRYTLTRTQIELAAADAEARAKLRTAQAALPTQAEVTFDDVSIAARSQGAHELETLTNKITPRVSLDDVVLPADVRAQLDEVASRVLNRDWVLRDWGFARRQSYGLGVNALFAGPRGTGKTMAAEALAHKLGKDLYKIDLTSVVSKYIGETEQKLEQVFRAGEATQAVLCIDEADSLLGKRSEVKDAHDRYANLEVSYLLQRMERYDGLIVLATNLLRNLDDAFLRRMAAIVHFPLPTSTDRRSLWKKAWPTDEHGRPTVPLTTASGLAVDYDFLAERFELTGGNIKNAVLAAAFAAADRPWFRFVTMWDVLQGVRREYQKLGQLMTNRELGLDQVPAPPGRPPSNGKSSRAMVVQPEPAHERTPEVAGAGKDPEGQPRAIFAGALAPSPATSRQSSGAEVAAGGPSIGHENGGEISGGGVADRPTIERTGRFAASVARFPE